MIGQRRRGSPTFRLLMGVVVLALVAATVLLVRFGPSLAGSAWKEAKSRAYAREKKLRFDDLLQRGWVTIHLDSRRPGVQLPERFMGEADFRLQYGRDMPRPIPDLVTNDEGVTATLSFDGQPKPTHVPWNAIYLITDRKGQGRWYREDTPPEVAAKMDESHRAVEEPRKSVLSR